MAFIIIHLYLITTGRTVSSNLKAMITGWEEMDEEEIQEIVEEAVNVAGVKIKPVKNDTKSHDEIKELLVTALKETENKVKDEKMEGQQKSKKKMAKNKNT